MPTSRKIEMPTPRKIGRPTYRKIGRPTYRKIEMQIPAIMVKSSFVIFG
jgi:hypothetical protein